MFANLPPRRRRWAIAAAALSILWVLFLVVAWTAGPGLLADALTRTAREDYGQQLSIGAIRVNPLRLAVTVERLALADPEGRRIVSFNSLLVNLSATSLVRGMLVLDEFRLDQLLVNIERLDAERFNFSLLADRLAARFAAQEGAAAEEGGATLHFLVHETEVTGAAFRFLDATRQPAYEGWMRPINLRMDELTSRPEREAPYDIVATLGTGGRIGWKGDLSLEPLRSRGRIELTGLGLSGAYDYVKASFGFALPQGTLDVAVDYEADFSGAQPRLRVTDASAAIDNLALTTPAGEPLFAFVRTEAAGVQADLVAATASVARVTTRGGRVALVREADGRINLLEALLPSGGAPADAAAPAPAPAATTAAAPAAPAPTSWKVSLAQLEVLDYGLEVTDRTTAVPARLALSQVNFRAQGIRWPEMAAVPFSLEGVAGGDGRFSAQGRYAFAGGVLEAELGAQQLALAPLSPYLAGLGRFSLGDGRVDWQGRVVAGTEEPAFLQLEGSGALTRLVLLDDEAGTPFLRLGRLGIEELAYDDRANSVALGRLVVDGLVADVARDRTGLSNIERMLGMTPPPAAADGDPLAAPAAPAGTAAPAPAPATKAAAAAPMAVRIGSVRIANGTLNYRDATPDLSFSTQLAKLGGRIDGLSSNPARRARVSLNGVVDNYAPLSIEGEVNPLAAVTYSDLRIRLDSLDLSALTPYTVTYIAYPLERGKLALALDWKVENRRFDSQNRLRLDGMALGEKREAPRATKLPVKLGVALLTNRDGDADLSVPAYGELDDPQFRYGRVVLKAIGNLLARAATAPFAALGGGGGESPDALAFAAGSTEPDAAVAGKLAGLARILGERPALSLNITGVAATGPDGEALRRQALELRLKRRWVDSPFRRGTDIGTLVLEPAQRSTALAREYEAVTGRAPEALRDGDGRPLPVDAALAQAERELLAATPVDEGALRELARARSQRIKDALLAQGVGEDRLFIVDGAVDAQATASMVASRVALDAR